MNVCKYEGIKRTRRLHEGIIKISFSIYFFSYLYYAIIFFSQYLINIFISMITNLFQNN